MVMVSTITNHRSSTSHHTWKHIKSATTMEVSTLPTKSAQLAACSTMQPTIHHQSPPGVAILVGSQKQSNITVT